MRLINIKVVVFLLLASVVSRAQMTDDFASTDEDTPVTFNVTDNDAVFLPRRNTVDLDTSLPGRQTSASTYEGTYTVKNSGDVTFTPVQDFFGISTLEYSMNYGFFGSSTGTALITVTVNSVNDPPVTVDDEAVTDRNVPIVIDVLANDYDVDDGINPSTVTLSDFVGGTFTANASGQVTYTPTPNFFGMASAVYLVQDYAGASSNKSTIYVTVNYVNDPPVAVNDQATMDENDPPININILANDYDSDGNLNAASVVLIDPTNGTFIVNASGLVTYTPPPDFNGVATVRYTVNDNDGATSNQATVTVTVNRVNQPPVAVNDAASMNEDGAPITINILANDNDPDGTLNPGSVVLSSATNGTFTVNTAGVVTYIPSANFYGVATAKYTVEDNEGAVSNEATISVTVNAVNDPPSFASIPNQRVLKNSATKSVSVTGISAGPFEIETLTLTATSSNINLVPNPAVVYNGTATTATLNFKPQPDQSGTVVITVIVTDEGQLTFSRTFQIEVVEVEITSTPVTVAAPEQVYEYFIEVTDVPETLTIVATQKPAWATLSSVSKNRAKLSGTPPPTAPLSSVVTLQLRDGATVLDQQQFTLIMNRLPTITSFNLQTAEDVPLPFTSASFVAAYSDPDNHPLTEVQFAELPKHGTLRLNTTPLPVGASIPIASISDISYHPSQDYNGPDTLYWNASDGFSYSANTASINFVITPVNDAPVIEFLESTSLQYELGSEIPIFITSAFRVIDVDDNNLTGAEIGIRFMNYQPGKEQLLFKDTLNIQGNFNGAAGILLLTGVSSVENYQAAIRTIKYNYVNLEDVRQGTTEVYFNLTDGKSLSETKSRSIELIYTFQDLNIPNAFTPNEDFINDTWNITSPNTTDDSVPYDEAIIRVYNKQGTLVHQSVGFERAWDGTFNGKKLPADTYFYTIDLKYNRVRYKGTVTILR